MKKNYFHDFVVSLFKKIKNSRLTIPIRNKGKTVAALRLITKDILDNDKEIKLLAKWRSKNQYWFPNQFKVTFEGTKKWAKEQLIEKDDRILFFITKDSQFIGHIGLNRFDFNKSTCQIDNVIRGKSTDKGMMTYALKTLIDFAFAKLKIVYLTLTTFADNERALKLYQRCGFKTIKKIPRKDKRFDLEMILDKTSLQ